MQPPTSERPPSTELRAQAFAAVRAELWRRGELCWKLDSNQLGLRAEILSTTRKRFVLECGRRVGKSYLLCLLAVEQCLRTRSRVVYGAPTSKEVAEILVPIIEDICEDAPADVRPHFSRGSGHYEFSNGSTIVLFGCEDRRKANRGRGPGADLVVIDEAGFIDILAYVLHSVVNPQTLTTGGRVLIASTPSDVPDHDFTHIAAQAEADGNYANRSLYDNPRLTPERIAKYVEDDAKDLGMTPEEYRESDTYRREHLAQRVVDERMVVLPDWAAKRDKLFVAVERPEFFNGMTVLDFGGADPHAAHFGYWHAKLSRWIIEDEMLLRNGENTAVISETIKAKEAELWGVRAWQGTLRGVTEAPTDALLACLPDWMAAALDAAAPKQPFTRWADNNLALVRDLYELHKLMFIPTAKDDLQLQVNNLNVMIRAEEVLVNPRCRHTDRHWTATTWENHKRKTFKRRGGEHGDLVATAVYGARNLDRRDPAPPNWELAPGEQLSHREQRRQAEERLQVARTFLGRGPLADRILAGRRR